MKEITTYDTRLPSNETNKFNFEIKSLKDAMEYSKLIADSDLAPKDYRSKPGNVLIAIQFGAEIGLLPLQAIQNIAVINGRPAVWGDAMIALVQSHHLCEYINEELKGDTAYCTVKRRGEDVHIAKFSREDAKKAGLLGKPGPWTNYPDRMLQMRARGFALRDKFADVLKGIAMREEVEDYNLTVLPEKTKNAAELKIKELIAEKSNPNFIEEKKEPDRIKLMCDKFAQLGISQDQIERRLGYELSAINEDDIKTLQDIYKMIKNGSAIDNFVIPEDLIPND